MPRSPDELKVLTVFSLRADAGDFSRLGVGLPLLAPRHMPGHSFTSVQRCLIYWTVWYQGLHCAEIADLSGAQSLPAGHSQSTRETKSHSSVIGQICAHRILWKHREGASGQEKAKT